MHAFAMNDVHIFFMAARMNDEKSFPYLKYFPIDLSIENDHLYDKSLSLFFYETLNIPVRFCHEINQ